MSKGVLRGPSRRIGIPVSAGAGFDFITVCYRELELFSQDEGQRRKFPQGGESHHLRMLVYLVVYDSG